MDYEKKYKEALKRARIWQNHLYDTNDIDYADELNYIFPELAELEDEKIRKQILSFLKEFEYNHYRSLNFSRWIAWLEKQGKKEQDVRYKHLEELLAADDIYQMAMNDTMVEEARTKAIEAISKIGISQLLGIEKQGEQKSTNIVPIPDGCHAYIKNRKVYIENYTKTTPANWSNPLIDWSNPLNTK